MLSPGDKVKDCEVIAPLGSGGMATLYLARRRGVGGFSRLVTLKLVHQHLAEDENIIKLFLDEARISAHVAHPNVVHVEEVGRYNGAYFIAMEYVHGVSLAELIARLTERRLCLRPKFCVWLAAQIAEALHAAHEATGENGVPLDIVHRDVSPQNVLISHTGHVKLIDFGLAKSQTDNHRSSEHTVLGKLRYMAPEQLRLEHADRRTDVYALGVMLWEMLASRSLLRCQRFDDERDWAIRDNPPPPSRYAPHPMHSLDRVVLKAIACDPDERYENAFQFRAALLRADPSASKLDAPMVAALLRSMLGDELDKRRANWPSEVAGELEVTPNDETSQRWSLEELTAEHRSLSAISLSDDEDDDDEDDEPTLSMFSADGNIETLAAVRADLKVALDSASVAYEHGEGLRVENAVVMLPTKLVPPRERTLLGMPMGGNPESVLDTLKVPPVSATLLELLPDVRSFTPTAVGSVCLVVGFFFGALLNRMPPPRAEDRLEEQVHAATDTRRRPPPPAAQLAHATSTKPRLPAARVVEIEVPPVPLADSVETAEEEDVDTAEVDPDAAETSRKSAARKGARASATRRSSARATKPSRVATSNSRKLRD